MNRDAIKQYLLDFQERPLPPLKPRTITIRDSLKIQVIIGARRVGKTYLLYAKMDELIQIGVRKSQILYLNFENPALNDVTFQEFKDILEIHWSLFPEELDNNIYLFLDEPQAIEKWDIAIRGLYDDYRFPMFLTGSSSKLLGREIATSIRGRSLTITLLPLSLQEFLSFRGYSIDPAKMSTKTRAKITHLMDEFLSFGGFPEIVLEPDEGEKMRILQDYLDLTIYRDIVDRYGVKSGRLMKDFLRFIVTSASKETSINKIYKTFKSQGIQVTKTTLYDYFGMLEDALFLFPIRKFEYSLTKENLSIPKIYLNDVGFLKLYNIEDFGRKFENTVCLELLHQLQGDPLKHLHYWKSPDQKEVDFLITQGNVVMTAIQVCVSLVDGITKEREIRALLACLAHFQLTEGLIITLEEDGLEEIDGKQIRMVPFWKWALS
ncbi:MAG TPA: ATP-binding protein [Candidatus Lokiarchaeia archaeon]|nr:ATP-binding protein [Candidatus Lokiarchaeia archaeon]